jgi:Ca2+-dependent lipid-binding protein
MKKFETKVHRKTLNPFFNETFQVERIIKKFAEIKPSLFKYQRTIVPISKTDLLYTCSGIEKLFSELETNRYHKKICSMAQNFLFDQSITSGLEKAREKVIMMLNND